MTDEERDMMLDDEDRMLDFGLPVSCPLSNVCMKECDVRPACYTSCPDFSMWYWENRSNHELIVELAEDVAELREMVDNYHTHDAFGKPKNPQMDLDGHLHWKKGSANRPSDNVHYKEDDIG